MTEERHEEDGPARRGFGSWQFAGVAAVLVLALAFGSWFTRPVETGPVAASPTAAGASPTPARAASTAPAATPTSTTAPTGVDHGVVYFARDGLPPIGVHVQGLANETTPEQRIASRVNALNNGSTVGSRIAVPLGAFNAFPLQDPALLHVTSVVIQGDMAIVDVALPGTWRAFGPIQSVGLQKQLVYTITEEPGVRRAVVRQNGTVGSIDAAILWDKPLSRDDISGYSAAAVDSITGGDGNDGELPALTTQWSVDDVALGLARFVMQVGPVAASTAKLPLFRVDVSRHDDVSDPTSGKWRLSVTVSTGTDKTTSAIVDRTPLRSVQAYPTKGAGTSVIYGIELDDLRPWRVYADPAQGRITVDIGGDPRLLSDRIAVTGDKIVPNAIVPKTITVTGAARTFEGNVAWRVLDANKKPVASGHTIASIGTSVLWGTFTTEIAFPDVTFPGSVTLEIYEASPRDGSEQGLVAIPLTVR